MALYGNVAGLPQFSVMETQLQIAYTVGQILGFVSVVMVQSSGLRLFVPPVLRRPDGSDIPDSYSPGSSVCPSSRPCTWCNAVASSGTTCMSSPALVPSQPPSELRCTWEVWNVDHTKRAYPLATQCSGRSTRDKMT